MATYTWVGTTSGDISVAANWGGTVPGAGDTAAVVDVPGQNKPGSSNPTAECAAGNITVASGEIVGGVWTGGAASGTITISGMVGISDGTFAHKNVSVGNSTVIGGGTFTGTGTLTISTGATVQGDTFSQQVVANAGNITGGTFLGPGTMTLSVALQESLSGATVNMTVTGGGIIGANVVINGNVVDNGDGLIFGSGPITVNGDIDLTGASGTNAFYAVGLTTLNGNIILGAISAYGAGSSSLAPATKVLTGTSIPNGTASLTLPVASHVLDDQTAYGVGGTGSAGTYVVVAAADVRRNTTFGAASAQTGTCYIPTASQVLIGIGVDATVGNVTLPGVGDVRLGTTFGAALALTGTLVVTGGGTTGIFRIGG